MNNSADYTHLMRHTQMLFPDAKIDITYTVDEIIHIDLDGHRFTFHIGSDDDSYLFSDGCTVFEIPLILDATWDRA